jgi:hypothetical protein
VCEPLSGALDKTQRREQRERVCVCALVECVVVVLCALSPRQHAQTEHGKHFCVPGVWTADSHEQSATHIESGLPALLRSGGQQRWRHKHIHVRHNCKPCCVVGTRLRESHTNTTLLFISVRCDC